MNRQDNFAVPNEWARICDQLQSSVSEGAYTNWLAPLRFHSATGDCIRLVAPSRHIRDWVRTEYMAAIVAAATALGFDIASVEIEADEEPMAAVAPPMVQHRNTRRSAAADTLWKPGQDGDIAYLHSFLAQTGLPRKRVRDPNGGNALWYERSSGNCKLAIQAGATWQGSRLVTHPIPYGPKPRLMLMDICTRAVQTRSPEVDLEPSVRQYLTNRLGVGWGGGRNGPYTLFRKQALALAACSLQLSVHQDARVVQFQGKPISQFEAWLENKGDQQPLWPGSLRLSAEFYGSLIDHGLPIDMRAYHALSCSAMAMDLYTFLAHRLWRIDGSVEIGWEQMRAAMAPEYGEIRNFRRDFLKALKDVQEVYPESKGRVQPIRGRVRLYHGSPPVEPKAPRRYGKSPKGQVIDA